MLEGISGLLSAVKQAGPVVLLGIALATGVSLFAPDWFITQMGIIDLRNQYRAYVGIGFVSSVSLLAARALGAVARGASKKYRGRQVQASLHDALNHLTPDEKAYLVPFVFGQLNTAYFQIEDGVVGGLVAKRTLYQGSTVGHMRSGFAFNMQPWAREYLTAKPHLLEGANPEPQGPPRRY